MMVDNESYTINKDKEMDNCTGNTIVLSSFYFAPIEYYSRAFEADRVVLEVNDNFQKQTYRNRCNILGANGVMQLNIPIEKSPTKKCAMKDVRISDHGNWQHLHWNAIVSAYNSSPFFEYYKDDFRPFFEKKIDFLHDLNEEFRRLIFRLLYIDKSVEYSDEYLKNIPKGCVDLRNEIHPKKESTFTTKPYWQVFSDKYGFVPNLSIIDLLFNMGNEARLYL